jgi:hypothetical protein
LSGELSQTLNGKDVRKIGKKITQRRIVFAGSGELFDRNLAQSRSEWIRLYVSETQRFEIVI